jgi:CheY-like chemotaxis protein/nitrogen-specific signal transduction histidine kinase
MTFHPDHQDPSSSRLEASVNHTQEEGRLFWANLSHELKTSLSAVLGAAELLKATSLSPQQTRLLDLMQGAGEHMLQLLGEVLDHSKLSAQRLSLRSKRLLLTALIENCILLFDPLAKAKGLKLYRWMELPEDCWVEVDAQRLTQMLSNLLSNAIKFTAQGHVLVHAQLLCVRELQTERQDWSGQEEGESANLVVKFMDTGCGIAKEHLSQLFEPFSQVGEESAHIASGSGSGLGLSIVHQLTELMGGQLSVSSTLGEGSIFELKLPLRRLSALKASEVPESFESRESIEAKLGATTIGIEAKQYDKFKNLLLGLSFDDAMLQKTLEFDLQAMGYRTIVIDPMSQSKFEAGSAPESDVYCVFTDRLQEQKTLANIPHSRVSNALNSSPRLLIEVHHQVLPVKAPPQQFNNTLLKAPFSREELGSVLSAVLRHHVNSPVELTKPQEDSGHVHFFERFNSLKVLLVEDNSTLRLVYQALLESLGCVIEIASDGRQAVKLVAEQEFDLVLMDCLLPLMDGFEAAKAIRQWEQESGSQRRLSIIALTASDQLSDQEKSLASGMNDFCSKPLTRAALIKVIEKVRSAQNQRSH